MLSTLGAGGVTLMVLVVDEGIPHRELRRTNHALWAWGNLNLLRHLLRTKP